MNKLYNFKTEHWTGCGYIMQYTPGINPIDAENRHRRDYKLSKTTLVKVYPMNETWENFIGVNDRKGWD